MAGKVSAGGKGYSAELTVDGIEGMIAALKEFEPKALRRMNLAIKTSLSPVASTAGASGPPSAEHKYVIRNSSRGKKVGTKVVAAGKNDAIFEFAGKPGNVKTSQGAGLIRWLNDRYGSPGRFLWAAWDAHKGTVIPAVEAAIREAERELQAAMDRQGVA